MSYVFKEATAATGLSDDDILETLDKWLSGRPTPRRVLVLPPDITRFNSYAGPVVRMLHNLLPLATIDVMPALGTHVAMTDEEMDKMYPGIPHTSFVEHRWRIDVSRVGVVPGEFVSEVSEGLMRDSIPVEINSRLLDKSYDMIFSVGQVVPHEVVGMANYNKNVFVGCGGSGMINASHYLGALYGLERMMGRDNTPVHRVFDYAETNFCGDIPLVYVLTVTASDETGPNVRSVAVGRDRAMFSDSIRVSQRFNLNFVDAPLRKVVVYLDPEEFHTTWLGNKSIYRTRMAIADKGELVVIGPGVHRFGEDLTNDALIRKYGYFGRDRVLRDVEANADLRENLGVAAHLMHGSSDGRFTITYAAGKLTRKEVESVGYNYLPIDEALAAYDVASLNQGFNTVNGEEIYFVGNPALGLWADRTRFENAGK